MTFDAFKATPIADRVYWVGAIDWTLQEFHGYLTSRGSTYNAFLIVGQKITLIDAVKSSYAGEMLSRIRSVIGDRPIDYIISNHAEMDHSGALPQVAALYPNARIFASAKGKEALGQHFHWNVEVEVVKTGDTISLGDDTLRFIETRMMHWPDSMLSFLDGPGILFSNDAFGMHLATAERFEDALEPSLIRYEAMKYFANILTHLCPIIRKHITTLEESALDIRMIAPDHGPIWRNDPMRVVNWYKEWTDQKPTRKAVLIFDTMWDSTATMARAITDGLLEGGASVRVMPLSSVHRSNVMTEILEAGALIVGSPTINNQIYPTVADVMNYLKGLKPKNLVGASFGSYGWSGEAPKHLDTLLGEMNVELIQPGLRVRYVPTASDLTACRELGAAIAQRIHSLG